MGFFPKLSAKKRLLKPMEFEAFVQIDSPQIEIHPMNFKTKLRSRKRLTNKLLFHFLFLAVF
jgi:hypothetical protein